LAAGLNHDRGSAEDQSCGSVDAEVSRAAQRLSNYRHAAKLLAERNALRSDLAIEQAAASIFAIGNSETYHALVLDGDWNDDEWAHWAQETLQNALLKP
jgi:uncharacterized membrane-anchored protein